MKRNSQELQNKNNELSPEKRRGIKEMLAITAVAALTSGLATAGLETAWSHASSETAKKPVVETAAKAFAEAELEIQYREALEQELRTAYIDSNKDGQPNDIVITKATNLDKTIKTIDDDIYKRGVIRIHINGSAKNKEVADNTDTPDYSYGDQGMAYQ